MGDIVKNIDSIKEILKNNLTADNTDEITKAVSELDHILEEHNQAKKEISDLKDRIVEQVKYTSFKDTPQNDEAEHIPSVDEAIENNLKKFENSKKEKK